ncbi:sulfatase [Dyadobacter sp. CY326]|uniref:sulfatase family protein n=1 Tax=Dyadobacter sp. CY326 TaxID=2907300 RepID=UPI001F19EC63|nr:sulfatase [Dyadobacter sp. CY326]MCE7064993.1 sulfatase [Dyadobacter sp. CY326]
MFFSKKIKIILFPFVALSFAAFLVAFIPKQAVKKPNVVLFFIDDLGYGDLTVTGALGYKTPNIDKLAAEGTRFTNFLAAQAVCSASRAALLTGCYPNRVGVYGAFGPKQGLGLNPKEETIAELLKANGYATGIFGKWHLGSDSIFLPLKQGFDEYYGVPYSHDMWPLHPWQKQAQYPPLHWIDGNKPAKEIKDLSDASELTPTITAKAVSFIKRNKKNPFFLYVPHPMPHVPLAASANFKGKSERGIFGDVLTELDWSVGQIMKELKAQGLDDNTIVIFTSDNGPWLNYGDHAGSSGGFREGKGTSYEGGQRVAAMIRWPGVVPAGRVSNRLLSNIDILPTLAKLTGSKLPKEQIDGIDFVDLLKGDDTRKPRENFLYYYRKNSLEAVRKDDWKLVFSHPGRTYEGQVPGKDGQPGPAPEDHAIPLALYNLERDPGERYDVYAQYPEIVAQLEKIAEAAREDLGDDLQQRTGKHVRPLGKVTK